MKKREEFPKYLADNGHKVGAEIGVCMGKFTKQLCDAGLSVYAIDPWIGYDGAGRTEKKQDKQEANFLEAQRLLKPHPETCIFKRKTSTEALDDFEDESLDFVFIDGDHRFPFVAQDIYFWYRKVKKGGIISGHDYFNTHPGATNVMCHVKSVVDAFIKAFEIDNLTIFGEEDPTPSWMIIKK